MQNMKKTSKNKMTKKQDKKHTPMDKLKMEIASELGLMDKVNEMGWGGLSAAETGRIGGIMTSKIKNGYFKNTATK